MKKSQRSFVVFASLIGVLTLTSALLLALAPAPLAPAIATSLFAVDTPQSFDVIFESKSATPPGGWKYIYIHHSGTTAGDAATLGQATGGMGDHFLIGNGDGCIDGEIQIGRRWTGQLSPLPPAGASEIDPACISICVVGDFDHTVPTSTQVRRLAQLVATLQGRLGIPQDHVLLVTQPNTPAGIGRYFPITGFRGQLLP